MEANHYRGQSLNSSLAEERLYEELNATAVKAAIAWQLERAIMRKNIMKKRLTELMDTSSTLVGRP